MLWAENAAEMGFSVWKGLEADRQTSRQQSINVELTFDLELSAV